jgi:hypothetical protein
MPKSTSLDYSQKSDGAISLTDALSDIVTLSEAKGLAARFFTSFRMTFV